jgi:hypothetical protein
VKTARSIDGFVFGGEARNDSDRSEDLFSVHAHALSDDGEDCRLHVEALAVVLRAGFMRSAAAGDHCRAPWFFDVDLGDVAVGLGMGDLRGLGKSYLPLGFRRCS